MAGTTRAEALIRHRARYVQVEDFPLEDYQFWIDGEVEPEHLPTWREAVRRVALDLVHDEDQQIAVSAIYALACTWDKRDIKRLRNLRAERPGLSQGATQAIRWLEMHTLSPDEFRDRVVDYSTFADFVQVLAHERAKAERLEADDPARYAWGGAYHWQNTSISDFLESALAGFDMDSDRAPTWRDLAEFLYLGKIYE